jgi:hypothetical protein
MQMQGLRFLPRSSVLERVNGDLADALTGRSGAERILRDLEEANAFVVAVRWQQTVEPLKDRVREQGLSACHLDEHHVSWDFSPDPSFESKLEWISSFVNDELIPLEPLAQEVSAHGRSLKTTLLF